MRGLYGVLAVLFFSFLLVQNVLADQVDLGWNQSTDSSVIGYKVYHGTQSRTYTDSVDVGSALTYLYSGLSDTQAHYFAVTDYSSSAESAYSSELVCYPVQVSACSNGQIQPGDIILAQGGSQTFTIVPATGYTISNVVVDGASAGAVSQYTFSDLSAVHTISASFAASAPIANYSIIASASANGSISPSGTTSVAGGANQSFTITPNANYGISNVTVDGTSVGPVSSYTFSSVSANHTISASFALNTYTLTPSAGTNGSISPGSTTTVKYGAAQTFTITPNANYRVSNVTVDGASVGAVSSYTFSNVTANHTISASFAANSYTLTPSAGANGSISPGSATTVNYGGSLTFTITPNANYSISNVNVDGISIGVVSNYTFSNVTANHTIAASFSQPPLADAGPDQEVAMCAKVTLNASNSRGAAGSISSYLWQQTGGTPVVLSNPSAALTSFTAPLVGAGGGALSFQVTVTDNTGLQATNSCIVNVVYVNQVPAAKVGADQMVSPYTIVTLDGSQSTDSEGSGLSYQWEQIEGMPVALSEAQSAKPTFVAPEIESGGTSMVFRLTVADSYGLESTATSIVNVGSGISAPKAGTSSAQTVSGGASVTLNGTNSSASPGDTIASYWWHQISGSPVTLSDPRTAKPTFTAPVSASDPDPLTFELTVTDSNGLKSRSDQTITVKYTGGDLKGTWTNFYDFNGTISGILQVSNVGNQAVAAGFNTAFYLSNDGISLNTPLGTQTAGYSLTVGKTISFGFRYSGTNLSGKYIIAVIDSTDVVTEANKLNNITKVQMH
jgi:hypothetical protein